MPIEVEVPDTKSIIEFPDDTPDLEINRQVQKHIQEWKAQNAPGPKISAAKKPQEKGWLGVFLGLLVAVQLLLSD